MGYSLSPKELHAEASPSQRKALTRVTAHGELPILSAELWHRGMIWVVVGSNSAVQRQFTISRRGKTEQIV